MANIKKFLSKGWWARGCGDSGEIGEVAKKKKWDSGGVAVRETSEKTDIKVVAFGGEIWGKRG